MHLQTLKRRGHGSRGHWHIKKHKYSKVRVNLKYVPKTQNEVRLGKFGPIHPEIRQSRKQYRMSRLKKDIQQLIKLREQDMFPQA